MNSFNLLKSVIIVRDGATEPVQRSDDAPSQLVVKARKNRAARLDQSEDCDAMDVDDCEKSLRENTRRTVGHAAEWLCKASVQEEVLSTSAVLLASQADDIAWTKSLGSLQCALVSVQLLRV